jgi:hypothetical protein
LFEVHVVTATRPQTKEEREGCDAKYDEESAIHVGGAIYLGSIRLGTPGIWPGRVIRALIAGIEGVNDSHDDRAQYNPTNNPRENKRHS